VYFKITKDSLGKTIKEEEFFTAEGKLLATHDETSDQTTYYVNNHLGSVIASVDHDGEIIEQVGYAPYGGPLSEISNENTFLGKVLERDLSMINLGARMHDPLTRQFLTPDTMVPLAINQVRASVRGSVGGVPLNQGHTLIACRQCSSQGCDHGAAVSWHGCQRSRARLRAPPPRENSLLPAG